LKKISFVYSEPGEPVSSSDSDDTEKNLLEVFGSDEIGPRSDQSINEDSEDAVQDEEYFDGVYHS